LVTGTRTFFDTVTHPAAISAEVGTLGYGANIGWGLNDKTELVVGWAGGDIGDLKDTIDIQDNTFDLETDYSNPYIGVNLRPAANWFTVGLGTIFQDNKTTLKSNNAQGVKIGNNDVIGYSGNLEASVENKNTMAPYLTLGFRPNITNNFGLFGEVGAAYTGGQKVTDAKINGLNRADLASDLQKDIDDENLAKWYPIAKIGATYRF